MVTANRIRLTGLLRKSPARGSSITTGFAGVNITAVTLVSLGLAAAPPTPSAPVPRPPMSLADTLTATTNELRDGVTAWSPKSADPPQSVVLYALYQQRIYRLL